MSLLRLLTTGKTLVGLKDSETRYRVSSQRLLPRFGPAKNPFCTTDRLEQARADSRTETEGVLAGPWEQRAVAGARLPAQDPSATPAVTVSPKPTAPLRSKVSSFASALRLAAAALCRWWSGRLRALITRPGGEPGKVRVLPPPKLTVQGELSLDKIRVVRNDLSDTDWEVVQVKSPAAPAVAAPAWRVAEKLEPTGTFWGRLAARLFGAGKT
jgi:hypothetical protein